jgi:hypothetical protein
MATNGKPLSGLWTGFILILLTALMIPAAWYLSTGWNFIALMVLMLLFMITLGVRISGRPAGILINERNLVSLSRFQLVLWTLIILSAYLTAAVGRIHGGSFADALDISLDPKLWALLGISTTSLIGTPLIQSTKKAQDPKPEEVAKTETALTAKGEPETQAEITKNSQGVLYANADIKDAAFSDMFEGDEVGNTAYVDVAKVQMFFFTVVAALSYGMALFQWIAAKQYIPADKTVKAAFPLVSGGLIAILGISHAGFLVNKSTTHTPTA